MRHGALLPGGAGRGTFQGLRTVTRQKHFKRRVRERMQKTGESYTTARLRLLKTQPAAPVAVAKATRSAQIRLRSRRLSERTRGPLGILHFAPSFGIVISLAIGVVAVLTIMTADAPLQSLLQATEGLR